MVSSTSMEALKVLVLLLQQQHDKDPALQEVG